jgi:hypothetical protein
LFVNAEAGGAGKAHREAREADSLGCTNNERIGWVGVWRQRGICADEWRCLGMKEVGGDVGSERTGSGGLDSRQYMKWRVIVIS